MDDLDPAPASDAAQAFEELRKELVLLRRSVRDWVSDQREPPDYTDTLAKITEALQGVDNAVRWVARRPSLTLTMEEIAARMAAAGDAARAQDKQLIAQASDRLRQTAETHAGWTAQARAADLQKRRLQQVGAVAAASGLILGLSLPVAKVKPVAPTCPHTALAWKG